MTVFKSTIFLTLLALVIAAGCDSKKDTPKNDASATTVKKETKKEEPKPADPAKAKEAPAEEGVQWVESKTYGVKFKAPDDWKVKSNAEALSATSPDGAITIILVGTESASVFEAALGGISKQIQLKDMKTEKSQLLVVNGLAGFHGTGSAVLVTEKGDQEIQFLGYALKLDAKKGVAVMVFAEAEMYEAKKEELAGIAKTIQKI